MKCVIPITLDYNKNEYRKLKYEVYHNYIIEGVLKKMMLTYDYVNSFNNEKTVLITRTQEVPKLIWVSLPSINSTLKTISIFRW